jgi:hypothetical protein
VKSNILDSGYAPISQTRNKPTTNKTEENKKQEEQHQEYLKNKKEETDLATQLTLERKREHI